MSKYMKSIYDPAPRMLRWVENCVGPDAAVEVVGPLAGGTSSSLHRVRVRFHGKCLKLVLRQFVNDEWLAAEPDLAAHKASSLRKAAMANIPTPELVGYDETGQSSGVPAVLMKELPGEVELKPRDFARWLRSLAEAAVAVHAVNPEGHAWSYFTYNDVSHLTTPEWSSSPDRWEEVFAVLRGPRPHSRECFIHRDYHPTNVLWQDGRLSGVVDWVNACRGAPGLDVAHCRLNLALLYGVEAADSFLAAYQAGAGRDFEYHPYWDLLALIAFLPGPPQMYEPWVTYGIDPIRPEFLVQRMERYCQGLLDRHGR